VDETIRSILAQHARLSCDATNLKEDDDLYRVGFTSHASVNVMLAIEDAFEIEFPNDMLRKSTFQSVSAIRAAVVELVGSRDGA
jgi:acyl carrier protein